MVRGRLVLCDHPGCRLRFRAAAGTRSGGAARRLAAVHGRRSDGRGGDACPHHAAPRPPDVADAGPDRPDPAADAAAEAIVRAIADHRR